MIQLKIVSKCYEQGIFFKKKLEVVKRVNLFIEKGETVGLVGSSGCGKSTLAKLMLGVIPVDEGCVMFEGTDLTSLNMRQLRPFRRKMQMLTQHPDSALNPRMTIRQSLEEPFYLHRDLLQYGTSLLTMRERGYDYTEVSLSKQRLSRKQKLEFIEEEIVRLLGEVGLHKEILSRYPHQVSGGQLQRIILARLLCLQPEFIILDEPTSMLDVSVQAQILHLLKKLQQKHHLTYLFISHDMAVVKWMSDRVLQMKNGGIF